MGLPEICQQQVQYQLENLLKVLLRSLAQTAENSWLKIQEIAAGIQTPEQSAQQKLPTSSQPANSISKPASGGREPKRYRLSVVGLQLQKKRATSSWWSVFGRGKSCGNCSQESPLAVPYSKTSTRSNDSQKSLRCMTPSAPNNLPTRATQRRIAKVS